jgi:hypothetical protein
VDDDSGDSRGSHGDGLGRIGSLLMGVEVHGFSPCGRRALVKLLKSNVAGTNYDGLCDNNSSLFKFSHSNPSFVNH